ncbi:late embryogenesis abundant protein D-34 [Quercus suber]
MSQEKPRRPREKQEQRDYPIRYGDVFEVSGELASKPVAPHVAGLMETAEKTVFGETQMGGTATVMRAAANFNVRAGFVDLEINDPTKVSVAQGVSVTQTDIPGRRIFTESVDRQVVGKYVQSMPTQEAVLGIVQSPITIGEALEATVQSAGAKPVDQSDAAAIQAAEARATGSDTIIPGGIAATAQSAAVFNAKVKREENKIKLGDVITGATAKLPADKVATKQDAEAVRNAEWRNNLNQAPHPGGVAASISAAARLNENLNAWK